MPRYDGLRRFDTVNILDRPGAHNALEAFGYAVFAKKKSSIKALNDIKDYEKSNQAIGDQIEISRKLYSYEPRIARAIDLQIELVAGGQIGIGNVEDEQFEGQLKDWADIVNEENDNIEAGLLALAEQYIASYLLDGNVFPWHEYESVPTKQGTLTAPARISFLDPTNVKIEDSDVSLFEKKLIWNPPFSAAAKEKSLERGKELDKRFTRHFKRSGRTFEKWGRPILAASVPAMKRIKNLELLDEDTIEGILNLVTIFKIGSDEFPADQTRLNKFNSLLNAKTRSVWMVWGHDVDKLQIGPNEQLLNLTDRFQEAYEVLFDAMGVPVNLISGRWNVPSKPDDAHILAFVGHIEHLQNKVGAYLNWVLRQIAKQNGKEDEFPKVRWRLINLKDPKLLRAISTLFYDRGLFTPQTAIESIGGDYNFEVRRKLRDKDNKDFNVLELFSPPELPFGGPTQNTTRDIGKKDGDFRKSVTKIGPNDSLQQDKQTEKQQDKVAAVEYGTDKWSGLRARGFLGGYIRTTSDNKCEGCAELNGQWYPLDELYNIMQAHENCQWELNVTERKPEIIGDKVEGDAGE